MDQQLPLIEAESDAALLLPVEEIRKRYTARQAQKVEALRDCILTMLACRVIPLETIAERAHVNFRTVQELGGLYAERIGQDSVRMADYAAGKSMKFLWLADQKAHLAGPKDLAIMHGITRDTAINMRLAGAVSDDLNGAIDVEGDDPKLKAAREFLQGKRLKAEGGTLKAEVGK